MLKSRICWTFCFFCVNGGMQRTPSDAHAKLPHSQHIVKLAQHVQRSTATDPENPSQTPPTAHQHSFPAVPAGPNARPETQLAPDHLPPNVDASTLTGASHSLPQPRESIAPYPTPGTPRASGSFASPLWHRHASTPLHPQPPRFPGSSPAPPQPVMPHLSPVGPSILKTEYQSTPPVLQRQDNFVAHDASYITPAPSASRIPITLSPVTPHRDTTHDSALQSLLHRRSLFSPNTSSQSLDHRSYHSPSTHHQPLPQGQSPLAVPLPQTPTTTVIAPPVTSPHFVSTFPPLLRYRNRTLVFAPTTYLSHESVQMILQEHGDCIIWDRVCHDWESCPVVPTPAYLN